VIDVRGASSYALLVVLSLLFAAPLFAADDAPAAPGERLRIALLAYDDPEIVAQQISPLIVGLQQQLPDVVVELEVLTMDQLESAVQENRASIIVTDPYHYLRLRASDRLSTAFATVNRSSPTGPVTSLGGTIVAAAGREDIQSLEDLRGRRVAIADRRGAGGFVLQLAELQRVDISEADLYLLPTGSQLENVMMVLRGEADVAFLRTSLLEAYIERGLVGPAELKVINRQGLGDYPFAVSTRLFPEWPLVATGSTDSQMLARALSLAYLQPDWGDGRGSGAIVGLSPPADYSGLTVAIQELALPPYDRQESLSFTEVWRSFRLGASLTLGFVLVILSLLVVVAQRNRRLKQVWGELRLSLQAQEKDRQRLKDLNRHFELFLDRTTDYVYFKDARRRYIFVSRSFARLTGYEDRHSLEGKTDLDVFPAEVARDYVQQETELFDTAQPLVDQRQRFVRPDGTPGWVSTYKWPVLSPDGSDVLGLFGISRDVTDMHDHEQQLERAAHYDSLTGLPNRSLFFDRLHQAMAMADRRGTELAVVYVDIDKFKNINDEHGHAVGDELLVNFAQLLASQLRRIDTVARLGGDEFVFLIADFKSRKECLALMDRLMQAIAQPRVVADVPMEITSSAGIAFYGPQSGIGPDQLLRQADQAMYRAKQAGRNRYRLLDEQQDGELRAFIDDAAEAIRKKTFELFFQPIVDIRRGEVVGAEALLRWRRDDGQLLLPGDFLPTISGHPLALDLERWVLREALAQQARWSEQGLRLVMHVNVTATDISQPEFARNLQDDIAAAVADVRGRLTLEILESAAVADAQRVNTVIAQCSELGVSFALDDFGTGYSSLSHIKDLRASSVKIDQRFVQSMYASYDDFSLLTAILAMAQAFDREAVAEGVETLEQGEMLLQLGCSLAQGFAIAPAMPAAEFETWQQTWESPAQWQKVAENFSSILPRGWSVGRSVWLEQTRRSQEHSSPADVAGSQ
jgi:diguanylate cyclase (GGDEF)-like protein/PAS domain S-box-containing protein